MYKFNNNYPLHIEKNFVDMGLLLSAKAWVLYNSIAPNPKLQPSFDVSNDTHLYAEKLQKIYWYDQSYWNKWLNDSCFFDLARKYLEKPILIKHEALIKRHCYESYVPLHQDIILWGRPYETAITLWVPLTDSSYETGGMFYYPVIDQLFEHVVDMKYPKSKIIDINKESINQQSIININASRGDVVICPSSLPYGSNYNMSNSLRIGMPFVFIEKAELNEPINDN